MEIIGEKIKLIPAIHSDREAIYNWLCNSDLTASVMGPPRYPDYPVPTYKAFCKEYPLSFFNASGDGRGRVYMIITGDDKVGTVGYDLLDKNKGRVVLDIWMKAEKYCGHGYGSDSLKALSLYLHKKYGITDFIISPSERNKRAVSAFHKAGFELTKIINKEEQEKEFGLSEYDDNLFMIKKLITVA